MGIIRFAIDQPITVAVGVLLLTLFGLVALGVVPIQLTPDVRKPVLTVNTAWPGAAPAEVEREIITQQEEVLKGLEGLAESNLDDICQFLCNQVTNQVRTELIDHATR